MNPATLQLILLGLNSVPQLFAAAQEIKGTLSETDLAKLNAASDAARASALADVARAEADLKAAGAS